MSRRNAAQQGYLVFLLAMTLFHFPASAGPVLTGGTEVATASIQLGNFVNGWDFVSRTNQQVTALGFWDSNGDGLDRAFQVGLWETATQALRASASIDSSDALDTSLTVEGGQWRYENLSAPVTLAAGTTYTLGVFWGSVDVDAADVLFLSFGTITADPNVTLVNQRRFLGSAGALQFPTGTNSGNEDAHRGNLNARLASIHAVPEPATFGLMGLGLLALGLARRR